VITKQDLVVCWFKDNKTLSNINSKVDVRNRCGYLMQTRVGFANRIQFCEPYVMLTRSWSR